MENERTPQDLIYELAGEINCIDARREATLISLRLAEEVIVLRGVAKKAMAQWKTYADSDPQSQHSSEDISIDRGAEGDLYRQCLDSLEGRWIIQRCTQKWVGSQLQYEDFPTPEGRMTREQMIAVLDRVQRENPDSEFRGHRV